MKRKKFRVYANSYIQYYIDVCAKNKEEAFKIAENSDGGDFVEIGYGDWEIEDNTIEELKEK